jgi:hypothetical protein
VILLWRAVGDALPDYHPALRLVRADQADGTQTIALQQGAPADGGYPTSLWRKGELLLDRRELPIGAQAPPAEGTLEVQVGDGQSLALRQISIAVANHLFRLPSVQHTANARFGEVAELVGYDMPITRTTSHIEVPLTLYWRAIASDPPSTSYVVFTHLLTDGMDRLVAQHDGPPVEGQRPTTSWLQDEIVVDAHLLRWREEYTGTCPVEIGFYDPDTGVRLPAYDREGKRMIHDRLILDQPVHAVATSELK